MEFVHSPLKYIGLSENSATPTIIVFPIKIAMFSSSAALRTPHFSQSTGKPNSNHVIHLYKSWKNQWNVGEIWNFYGFSMVSPHCWNHHQCLPSIPACGALPIVPAAPRASPDASPLSLAQHGIAVFDKPAKNWEIPPGTQAWAPPGTFQLFNAIPQKIILAGCHFCGFSVWKKCKFGVLKRYQWKIIANPWSGH